MIKVRQQQQSHISPQQPRPNVSDSLIKMLDISADPLRGPLLMPASLAPAPRQTTNSLIESSIEAGILRRRRQLTSASTQIEPVSPTNLIDAVYRTLSLRRRGDRLQTAWGPFPTGHGARLAGFRRQVPSRSGVGINLISPVATVTNVSSSGTGIADGRVWTSFSLRISLPAVPSFPTYVGPSHARYEIKKVDHAQA
jgi:hypothetical protein